MVKDNTTRAAERASLRSRSAPFRLQPVTFCHYGASCQVSLMLSWPSFGGLRIVQISFVILGSERMGSVSSLNLLMFRVDEITSTYEWPFPVRKALLTANVTLWGRVAIVTRVFRLRINLLSEV